jgi:hypothetical protein
LDSFPFLFGREIGRTDARGQPIIMAKMRLKLTILHGSHHPKVCRALPLQRFLKPASMRRV